LNEIPEGSPDEEHIAMEMHSHEGDDPGVSGCGSIPSKNITTMPSDWTNGPDQTIKINTEPGLKYDLASFQVYEGSKVQITFTNDDDMLHNLVVTKPGTFDKVGKAAMELGLSGPQKGYIPETNDVLFNTCILQPETSQSIYFVAPKEGDYDYVCTFPGHYASMNGTMKVVKKP
jgi:azurin